MLELLSALLGGLVASAAGGLAAFVLVVGLRKASNLQLPTPGLRPLRRAAHQAMVHTRSQESKRPS